MENSQPNKMLSKIIELIASNIIFKIITIIVSILLFILVLLWIVTSSFFMTHPFLGGVLFSWFVAVASTFIVLFCAFINSDKKKEYDEIFKQSERWLRAITVCILFYLAIHLASEAFWEIGIPILGEPYAELGFLKYISPQDVFLLSFVFFLIISIYFIAPYFILKSYWILKHRYRLHVFHILIPLLLVSSLLAWKFTSFYSHAASLIYSYYPSFAPFKSTAEQSQTAISSLPFFVVVFVLVSVIYLILQSWETMKIPKGSKGEFRDLGLVFCLMPAIIVASLVSAENELVRFPNISGHVVVGLLFIGGFATFMSMITISFRQERIFPWSNPVWVHSTILSLIAISFFSMVFLLLRNFLGIDIITFGKAFNFSVAIMLLILLYGFLYEKLQKYHFTEWWRREYKPIALIISILLISIVSLIDPKQFKIKLIGIGLVLVVGFCLPWIIMSCRKLKIERWKELPTYLKKLIKKEIKITSMHQGMVMVKVETAPGSLKNVVKELDGIEGVYQTMVVKGDYDLCMVVEGMSFDDIERKIIDIRKAKGVASTTTLMDIREFFDREVR
jgi:DNA-binding Lrp family transcriptional regulator